MSLAPSLWADCLVLAEELSFRRAADRLGIDQSVLSRRIQQAEEGLGFRLFTRTSRRVAPTEAGAIVLDQLRRSAADLERTMDAARIAESGRTGRVRVAYMSFAASDAMPGLAAAFATRNAEVQLDIRYMHTAAQKLALMHGEIDVGLMIGPVDTRSFAGLDLAQERLVVVAPKAHALVSGPHDPTPADVSAHPLVLGHVEEWDYFRALLRALFLRRGLDVTVGCEVSDTAGILGLVAAGMGPTVLVESVARSLPEGLAARPLADCPETISTVMCWRPEALGAAARRFVILARARRFRV